MRRPRSLLGAAGLAVAVLLAGCAGSETTTATSPLTAATTAPVGDGATPRAEEAPSPVPASGVDLDAAAGVTAMEVPDVGEGIFTTAPGTAPEPDPNGRVKTVAVQVENGLPADPGAAADFVLATLNDPRGWPSQGWTFARTEDTAAADIIVVLASPQTSADMCRPLITGGRLSCREGRRAIITWYRWIHGHEGYGEDRTGYRQYVINHEVGHALGRGHVSCPGAGKPAPVMMQQTKGLGSCTPNPWVTTD